MLEIGFAPGPLADGARIRAIVAADLVDQSLRRDRPHQAAQAEVLRPQRGEILRRDQPGEPARVACDHGAAAAQPLERGARAGEHQIELDEMALGILDLAPGLRTERLELDRQRLAGGADRRGRRRLAERDRAPGPLRQRPRPRRNAREIHRIVQHHDARRIDPVRMDEAVATGLVDRHIGGDLGKMRGSLDPMLERMAHVDRGHAGEADDRLAARDHVMRVDDVGRLGDPAEIVDHGDAPAGQLLREAGRSPAYTRSDGGRGAARRARGRATPPPTRRGARARCW